MTEKIREMAKPTRPEHISSASLLLLLAVAASGALYYSLFLFNIGHVGNIVPYLFVLIAESIVIFQALTAYWTILAGSYNPKDFAYIEAKRGILSQLSKTEKGGIKVTAHPRLLLHEEPVSVDVLITVYGEPLEIIHRTVVAAMNIIGAHTTYILDDGKSNAVKAMAKKIGARYIRRELNIGAKAGNINHALSQTKAEFFVIFDADHVPSANFLYETMPFFADDSVAFVQTPQSYRNLTNPVSRGASYAQDLFYRFIQAGKNRFNAAFCVGTNVVFRREAVDAVGGIYQDSNSEDIWTSLLLHEQGYRSVYIPDVLAIGEAPDTIQAFTKQQLRWATGGFEILLKGGILYQRNLTVDQKLQYLTTSMFYLLGLSAGLLFLLPPLAIFASLTPITAQVGRLDWFGHYIAFYGLQIIVASYCMRGFKFETLVLGTGSFPTYIRALYNVIRSRNVHWKATGQASSDSAYQFILPQVLLFIFLVFTSVVGVRQILNGDGGSGLAVLTNLFNTYIIGSYLNIALKYGGEKKKKKRNLRSFRLTSREIVSN